MIPLPLLLCFTSLSSPSTHKSRYAGGPTHPTRETRGLVLHTCTFFCTTITQENYNSILFYPVNILHILWAHRVTPQAECTLCWSLGSQDFHHTLKHLSPSSYAQYCQIRNFFFKTCLAFRCINCDISAGFKCLLFALGLPRGLFHAHSDLMTRFAIKGLSSSFPPSLVLQDLRSPSHLCGVRISHTPDPQASGISSLPGLLCA